MFTMNKPENLSPSHLASQWNQVTGNLNKHGHGFVRTLLKSGSRMPGDIKFCKVKMFVTLRRQDIINYMYDHSF